jgi:membrane protease YdiL (CAAX protease family)
LFILGITIVGGLGFTGGAPLRREEGFLLQGVIASLAALGAASGLLRWVDRRPFRSLGLWFYSGWRRELGTGLLLGFFLISVIVGLAAAFGQLRWERAELDGGTVARGFYLLLVIAFAAAAEELAFRGYGFQRLLDSWGAFYAVFFLAVFFAALHSSNPAATPLSTVNTGLAGVLLALAYLRTRGLWFPIGLHFSWNFSQGFIYGVPISGIPLPPSLLVAQNGEAAWLSGGNYGPEGSVLATGVTVAACFWLARTRRVGISAEMARVVEWERGRAA